MATVTQQLFDRHPAPPLGKPPHVWQGVSKRPDHPSTPADQKRHPWLYRCPASMCFYNVSFSTEKDAKTGAERHQASGCPWFAGGPTNLSWGVMSESFIVPIWKLLDECMDTIKAEENLNALGDAARERARNEARAYANVLAVLMPPFFKHPDEIAREAMTRWKARQAGEDYETHGIGRLRYSPPNTTLVTMNQNKTPSVNLDEGTIKGIKAALDSGLFQPEQLAATYAVPVAYIKSLKS